MADALEWLDTYESKALTMVGLSMASIDVSNTPVIGRISLADLGDTTATFGDCGGRAIRIRGYGPNRQKRRRILKNRLAENSASALIVAHASLRAKRVIGLHQREKLMGWTEYLAARYILHPSEKNCLLEASKHEPEGDTFTNQFAYYALRRGEQRAKADGCNPYVYTLFDLLSMDAISGTHMNYKPGIRREMLISGLAVASADWACTDGFIPPDINALSQRPMPENSRPANPGYLLVPPEGFISSSRGILPPEGSSSSSRGIMPSIVPPAPISSARVLSPARSMAHSRSASPTRSQLASSARSRSVSPAHPPSVHLGRSPWESPVRSLRASPVLSGFHAQSMGEFMESTDQEGGPSAVGRDSPNILAGILDGYPTTTRTSKPSAKRRRLLP